MKNERNNPQGRAKGDQSQKGQTQREGQRKAGDQNINEKEDQMGENAGGNFGPTSGMRSDEEQRNEQRQGSEQKRDREQNRSSEMNEEERQRNEHNEGQQR